MEIINVDEPKCRCCGGDGMIIGKIGNPPIHYICKENHARHMQGIKASRCKEFSNKEAKR